MKYDQFSMQIEYYSILFSRILRQFPEIYRLDVFNQSQFNRYLNHQSSLVELSESLLNLCIALQEYYHQKVILLIDEYDVPLQTAYTYGYYDQMVQFLNHLFGSALKTNPALEKGIMTGCLRIAKESILPGLNNFRVYSIFDESSATDFGFTKDEVHALLCDYGIEDQMNTIKEWYDGYRFGKEDIYNPWSVLNYVDDQTRGNDQPHLYWANTSGNDIIRKYLQNATSQIREEFNQLILGKTIKKDILEELTYPEMDDLRHIYSFLLFTGYLKCIQIESPHGYVLQIPNHEIKTIYQQFFIEWFSNQVMTYRSSFQKALLEGDVLEARKILNLLLARSISYFDYNENFYHGFCLGLLQDLHVKSNRESGMGRCGIAIIPHDFDDYVILIECKISNSLKKLKTMSQEGLHQIERTQYIEDFKLDGFSHFYLYGIAFYQKSCYISMTSI